ncbi:MAG: hypothetical protein QGI81_14110, partial [Pseudomonadales bacterium]|nr:hypothetical protein [Pseudomonadales bacterium]
SEPHPLSRRVCTKQQAAPPDRAWQTAQVPQPLVSIRYEKRVNTSYPLGKFSAADIMLGYTLFLTEKLVPFEGYPEAGRYWPDLKSRPAARKVFSEDF